jgi:pyruvate,water dikinase
MKLPLELVCGERAGTSAIACGHPGRQSYRNPIAVNIGVTLRRGGIVTDLTDLIDTVPSERYTVYTRLNANDVMPDPITPLGATLVWIPEVLPGWANGYMWLDAFTPAELAGEPYLAGGFHYGYLYVNQTAVRIIGIRAGIGADAIDAAFFSHPNLPPHHPHPDDANEAITAKMAARTQWALTTTTFPELEEERELADRIRADRPNLAAVTNEVLIARARSIAPMQRLVWGRGYCIASNQASIGPGVIASLVGAADPTLTIRVIGSAGDVDSALPSYALWDLSREVRADAALSATFEAGDDGLLDRLRAEHPAFATRFDGFLLEYGYRGPSEWDPGMDSWETQPELPLALIGRLRHLEDDQNPALRREMRDAEAAVALQEALAVLGDNEEAVQTLHLAIAAARRWGAWRERGKTTAVKLMHEVRIVLFELGRRLAASGDLDHPRQVFVALESELDRLAGHAADLREQLREREKEWRELFEIEPPTFVVGGEPMKPLSELIGRGAGDNTTVQPGDVLVGAPASAGLARGRARVIRTTSDIASFEPGEILVAPQTDPSWTPLFMVAAGVVVDVGAMGSHAMIVSRELGIPCAAGVTGATNRIPDGALVEVDGSSGKVTILEG